ncbi:hypothetical protein QUF74_07770 [Candidatus Halobeggiatoa sp. HSG11]|nr:hypothetical protein [Candidatus Halobeggiatoa sp. HSG11]
MTSFQQYYKGSFTSALRWHQLDDLWEKTVAQPDGWYIYHIGRKPPTEPTNKKTLTQFIQKVDKILHQEHKYDYCGIVYADNKETPAMIKIFDPKNLGVVCGTGKAIIHPRWLLTRILPESIEIKTEIKYKRWLPFWN